MFHSQDRKKFFPPRPRGNRKPRKCKKKGEPPVKLENLKSALIVLSQDSGIGSSQEMSSLPECLDLLNEDLKSGMSDISSSTSSNSRKLRNSSKDEQLKSSSSYSSTEFTSSKSNRKRYISESSLSDFEIKKPRIDEKLPSSQTSDLGSEVSTSSFGSYHSESQKSSTEKDDCVDVTKASGESVGKSTVPPSQNEKENSELCIICNNAPKDSIFLHTNIAHQCCCYRCAKRTLHTIKRCPICNRSVNKVVKIYTS